MSGHRAAARDEPIYRAPLKQTAPHWARLPGVDPGPWCRSFTLPLEAAQFEQDMQALGFATEREFCERENRTNVWWRFPDDFGADLFVGANK